MRRYALIFLLLALIRPAWGEAVEYRLQVVSLYEETFSSYVDRGSSLSRLEAALDRQEIARETVIYDRWVQPAEASVALAFGASPVKAELVADRRPFLPEFRWEGTPGTRTLWVVKSQSFHLHELGQLALKGTTELRQVLPSMAAVRVARSRAVGVPVNLIDFWDGRSGLWDRWLSRYVDMSDGIGVVVGIDPNIHPDRVYLVIQQSPESRTFKVVLGWRQRRGVQENLFENGSSVGDR